MKIHASYHSRTFFMTVFIGIVPSASAPFSMSGTASGLVTDFCSLSIQCRHVDHKKLDNSSGVTAKRAEVSRLRNTHKGCTYSIGKGVNSEYFSIKARSATSSRYWSLSSFKCKMIRVPVVSIGSESALSAAIVY